MRDSLNALSGNNCMLDQLLQMYKNNQIPEGWVETTAEEYCLKVADGTHNSPKQSEEGKFLVTSKNLKNGQLDMTSSYKISFVDFAEVNKRSRVDKWDVLLSMIGTVGEVCLIAEVPDFAIKNVGLFKCGEEIKAKFLYYYLKSSLGQNYILSRLSGTTQKYITLGELRQFPIVYPSNIQEQKSIVRLLSSFDDKIELLREQNKILEQTAQTIFQEWFRKHKVGDKLPDGWKIGKITEIIQKESISYKCDKKDLDIRGKIPIIDQGSTGLYGYTSRDADFIASKTDPVILFTNHTCNYWFVDYPFCAIQNILPYRGKKGYDVYFLYFMTKGSISFVEYKGHWPDFEAKDFIIPTLDKANEFSHVAKPILEKISNNNVQIQSIIETRNTILPKLINGEVRLLDIYKNA